MIRKLPAYHLYMFIRFAFALFFTMMAFISALYRVQTAGLTPLQLILLGTALEVATFTFEVPTGIIADVYSRRLSVIIGYIVIGAGFLLEGFSTAFWPILLSQFIWGVGYTFISGAQEAWLADEVGEAKLTQVYLRASQFGRAGALIGIVLGTFLGNAVLAWPIRIAGFCTFGISLALILFMPETGFSPTPKEDRSSWQMMGVTFREGLTAVRGQRLLVLIMAIAMLYGLSSEGRDRLWEAHILTNFGLPEWRNLGQVYWFGLVGVVNMVLGIAAAGWLRRFDVDRPEVTIRLQWLLNAVYIGTTFAFALAGNVGLALFMAVTSSVARDSNGSLFGAWINKQIPRNVRATVLSMFGQLDAIGQIAGGIIVGVVATAWGLRAALVGVGVLLLPVLILYALAGRWQGPPATLAVSEA